MQLIASLEDLKDQFLVVSPLFAGQIFQMLADRCLDLREAVARIDFADRL